MLGLLLLARSRCAQSDFPSDAVALAAKLGVGWNLGNALESCSSPDSASETSWGNPATTKALIDAVKAAGFKSVRIPCAWSGYIEDKATFKLKDSWLARVKEVVGWVVGDGLHAIVNIHWDGGWCEEHPTYADQKAVTAKLTALWRQIASHLEAFDERLLFAGANEIRAGYGKPTKENIEVQQAYLQAFVDAVRATGGNNQYRNLLVQGYRTDIQLTVDNPKLPKDSIGGRLLVEVHFYDPWDFCGEGGSVYLWGKDFVGQQHLSTWGQEDWVDQAFAMMKTSFVDKKVPVVLGEFGVVYHATLAPAELAKHVKARNYYFNYVTKAAVKHGIVPFVWDNGQTGDKGNGLFDRKTNKVAFPDAVNAIISGGK
jgi:endoglucanase